MSAIHGGGSFNRKTFRQCQHLFLNTDQWKPSGFFIGPGLLRAGVRNNLRMEEFVGLVFKSCSALRPGALGERGDLGAVDTEGMDGYPCFQREVVQDKFMDTSALGCG